MDALMEKNKKQNLIHCDMHVYTLLYVFDFRKVLGVLYSTAACWSNTWSSHQWCYNSTRCVPYPGEEMPVKGHLQQWLHSLISPILSPWIMNDFIWMSCPLLSFRNIGLGHRQIKHWVLCVMANGSYWRAVILWYSLWAHSTWFACRQYFSMNRFAC